MQRSTGTTATELIRAAGGFPSVPGIGRWASACGSRQTDRLREQFVPKYPLHPTATAPVATPYSEEHTAGDDDGDQLAHRGRRTSRWTRFHRIAEASSA